RDQVLMDVIAPVKDLQLGLRPAAATNRGRHRQGGGQLEPTAARFRTGSAVFGGGSPCLGCVLHSAKDSRPLSACRISRAATSAPPRVTRNRITNSALVCG